jgi:hypothetical protein
MSDFVLEINGAGEGITLEPVGTIDLQGARTMLDVLDSLRRDRRGTHLEIRLDRVTGVTADARQLLSVRGVPVEMPTPSGVG